MNFLLIYFIFLKPVPSYFQNLPSPDSFDFAIALISDVGNNFEPCGCGHPPFKGGELSKKAFVIKYLKNKYKKKLLTFDTGNYINPSGKREFLGVFRDVLKIMKVDALAISRKEVTTKRENIEFLVNVLKFPYYGIDFYLRDLIPPYKEFKLKNAKIYFTSFVPHRGKKRLLEYEKNAFKELENKMEEEDAFLVVVTSSKTDLPFESKLPLLNIIGRSPKFDVKFEKHENIYQLTVSKFGLYLPVLFFRKKGKDYEMYKLIKIPLNDKVEKDPEVEKLKEKWKEMKKKRMEEMRKKIIEKSRLPTAEKCKPCHQKEYKKWKETKHAKAFEVLISMKKENNFECLSCHTTFYGKPGGFQNYKFTKELANIHCIQCHKVDMKTHPTTKKAITKGEKTCRKCHVPDRSPLFDFKKYWEKIKH